MTRPLGVAAIAALVATVAAANYATSTWGLIPAGFGLVVTAGTYAAGLTLAARDVVHDVAGARWSVAAIAAGCVLSAVLGDARIAVASATAFAVSELADLAVYAPLRRRRWRLAVAASAAAGAIVDSVVFLSIAGFGLSWPAVAGQLLVKAVWVTGVFLLAAEVVRRVVRGQRVVAAGA